MRIKKFVDEDMIRLIRRVKEELGPEAVIVSTSQAADGRSELVAAVENDEIGFSGDAPQVYPAAYSDTAIRERLDYHETGTTACAKLLALCRQKAVQSGKKDDAGILTAVFDDLFSSYDILGGSQVKLFAGIQGSGKTTALVKTAALARFRKIPSALISADGVRAGANAQLQSFASVLEADFQAVREPEELSAAVFRAREKYPLVLVDTPGVNPFSETEIKRLSGLIKAAGGEAILTMDAGFNAYDAGETAALFASAGVSCLLPTKLDLCRRIGGVLTAAVEGGFKLGWASVSAHVSKGLMPLDNPSLAQLLLA